MHCIKSFIFFCSYKDSNEHVEKNTRLTISFFKNYKDFVLNYVKKGINIGHLKSFDLQDFAGFMKVVNPMMIVS